MITQDQLKDVLERADALHRYLEIDKKKIEYEEEDLRTQAPDLTPMLKPSRPSRIWS